MSRKIGDLYEQAIKDILNDTRRTGVKDDALISKQILCSGLYHAMLSMELRGELKEFDKVKPYRCTNDVADMVGQLYTENRNACEKVCARICGTTSTYAGQFYEVLEGCIRRAILKLT